VNYRNHSMSELVTCLSNEVDPDRFIEAAKVFVQKFVDKDYVPRQLREDALDAVKGDSFGAGYDEARTQCREEMAEYLNGYSEEIDHMTLENLLTTARTMG